MHDQSRALILVVHITQRVMWSFFFSFCLSELHRNPHIPSFSCILPHRLLDIGYHGGSFFPFSVSVCPAFCSQDDLDRSYHPTITLSPFHLGTFLIHPFTLSPVNSHQWFAAVLDRSVKYGYQRGWSGRSLVISLVTQPFPFLVILSEVPGDDPNSLN